MCGLDVSRDALRVSLILLGLSVLGLLTSTAFGILVSAAIGRFVRRHRNLRPAFDKPVSLFKPLHGNEPNLEAHLETFFQQGDSLFQACDRRALGAELDF